MILSRSSLSPRIPVAHRRFKLLLVLPSNQWSQRSVGPGHDLPSTGPRKHQAGTVPNSALHLLSMPGVLTIHHPSSKLRMTVNLFLTYMTSSSGRSGSRIRWTFRLCPWIPGCRYLLKTENAWKKVFGKQKDIRIRTLEGHRPYCSRHLF